VSRVRLLVDLSVSSIGRGADDIENTASSNVACWTVFTELLPGNVLIKSVTTLRPKKNVGNDQYMKLHNKEPCYIYRSPSMVGC
jgi:hypothetical protein